VASCFVGIPFSHRKGSSRFPESFYRIWISGACKPVLLAFTAENCGPSALFQLTGKGLCAIGLYIIGLVATLSIYTAAIEALVLVVAAICVGFGAPAVAQLLLVQPLDHHLFPPRLDLLPLETVSLS
jgi:hypothetical protein